MKSMDDTISLYLDVSIYLCNKYLIRFKSVIYIQPRMTFKKAVRNITISGTSKIIPVSSEVKELGLGPKDSVVAFLAIPGSLEEYALDLALTFCNPDAYYVNERYMCSRDSYPNGMPVENKFDESNKLDCQVVADRLEALNYMIETMRSFTKTMVSGPVSYYSEDLRTFVAKFDPDEVFDEDEITRNIKKLMAQINVLRACLNTPLFDFSPLSSVKELQRYMDRGLEDVVKLFHCPSEQREELCKKLNDDWKDEVNNIVYHDMYFVGLTIRKDSEGNPSGRPEFSVVAAPTYRLAVEKIHDESTSSYAFGPYMERDECADLVAYLKLKWKLELRSDSDENTVILVKNMINDYNIISGE